MPTVAHGARVCRSTALHFTIVPITCSLKTNEQGYHLSPICLSPWASWPHPPSGTDTIMSAWTAKKLVIVQTSRSKLVTSGSGDMPNLCQHGHKVVIHAVIIQPSRPCPVSCWDEPPKQWQHAKHVPKLHHSAHACRHHSLARPRPASFPHKTPKQWQHAQHVPKPQWTGHPGRYHSMSQTVSSISFTPPLKTMATCQKWAKAATNLSSRWTNPWQQDTMKEVTICLISAPVPLSYWRPWGIQVHAISWSGQHHDNKILWKKWQYVKEVHQCW